MKQAWLFVAGLRWRQAGNQPAAGNARAYRHGTAVSPFKRLATAGILGRACPMNRPLVFEAELFPLSPTLAADFAMLSFSEKPAAVRGLGATLGNGKTNGRGHRQENSGFRPCSGSLLRVRGQGGPGIWKTMVPAWEGAGRVGRDFILSSSRVSGVFSEGGSKFFPTNTPPTKQLHTIIIMEPSVPPPFHRVGCCGTAATAACSEKRATSFIQKGGRGANPCRSFYQTRLL